MARARRIPWFLVLVATLLGAAPDGRAADWGGISPGASTIQTVRDRYGAPSRESHEKEEGYDTTRWIYEGARAPAGMKQLRVDFGMLTAAGYRPDLVRYFKLDPKPLVFDRTTIIVGWGVPDRFGEEEGRAALFYRAGLLVILDPTEQDAVSMVFTIPQSEPPPASK